MKDNPLIIVDVGAAGGLDPKWRRYTPHYKAVLFEPDVKACKPLYKDKRNLILNSVLSDSEKELTIIVCRNRMNSSCLMPNWEFVRRYPNYRRFDPVDHISVKAEALDTVLDSWKIHDVDALKVDVQGHELNVLIGANRTLENVISVEVEIAFHPIYVKQPLFNEVDKFLRFKGFTLYDLSLQRWRQISGRGRLVFADALYMREPEMVKAHYFCDLKKIRRAMNLYALHGYIDDAEELKFICFDKAFNYKVPWLQANIQNFIRRVRRMRRL